MRGLSEVRTRGVCSLGPAYESRGRPGETVSFAERARAFSAMAGALASKYALVSEYALALTPSLSCCVDGLSFLARFAFRCAQGTRERKRDLD
jgi:hypothetical protein